MRLSHSPRAMGAPLPRSDQSPALSNRPRPHGRQKPRPHRVAPPPSAAPGVTRRSGRGRGGQGRCHRGLGDRDNAGGGGGRDTLGGGRDTPGGAGTMSPVPWGWGRPRTDVPGVVGTDGHRDRDTPGGGGARDSPPTSPGLSFPPASPAPRSPVRARLLTHPHRSPRRSLAIPAVNCLPRQVLKPPQGATRLWGGSVPPSSTRGESPKQPSFIFFF